MTGAAPGPAPTPEPAATSSDAPPAQAAGPDDGPYHFDGLFSIHDHAFMREESFRRAYERGVAAAGQDYQWYWRVHVGLWAARHAMTLSGDFVECGVNRGFLASAIMQMLDWDATGRTFHLMDTFDGLDPRYVSDEERAAGILERTQRERDSGFLVVGAESVRRNFAQWRNVAIIEGPIPDTLAQARPARVAFLHIDMNCSPPEIAAIEHFWDRLSPGAPVLLDDYAYHGYGTQKIAMDAFARRKGVAIVALPTGQGLLLKPGAGRIALVPARKASMRCFACGGDSFLPVRSVLWPELIEAWGLSEAEARAIDRQQGECCARCGANLRSSALAKAILAECVAEGPLARFVTSPEAVGLTLLEINEAGTLSPLLRKLPGHVFGAYPEVDMHALPWPDASFDLVVHSDTLEHVEHPLQALKECARVLKPGGAICCTVPVIVGRMSRSRSGLPKSWHGDSSETDDHLLVRTEFGADMWTLPAEAGLTRVTIHTVEYPAAIAICAAR